MIAPNGIEKFYGYDLQGNNVSYLRGNLDDSMQYNHFGQVDKISRAIDGVAVDSIDYGYESGTGLLAYKETNGKITNYAHNALGSITSVIALSELKRTYTRDALDRITKVSADGKDFVYEYYGDGQIKKITYPNTGITTEYTYDNANQPKTLVTKNGNTVLYSCSYTYDSVDNITSVSGTENASYTYDDLYRLKTSTQNGATTTYEYDSRNNLIAETTTDGKTKTYEYGGDNRLYKVTENGVETIYEYDLNGNLIRRGNDEFAYDADDKLIYSNVNGVVTTHEIGLDGLRKAKTTDNTTTTYDLDENGNVICENDDDIILGHKPLAKEIDGEYFYYIYNGHGDVVMMIDENGNIKNSYAYDPWGAIVSQSETIENSHKYAGEYYDDETGLIYLRARYYDPSTRRFIQEDPIRDDLNWYAYCGNNPVMFVDPLGLSFKFKNMEDYQYFQQRMYDIYGSEELIFDFDEDELVLHGITGEYNGSKTATSLINLLLGDLNEYDIVFKNNRDGGGTLLNTITIGLSYEIDEGKFIPQSDEEVNCIMVHEFAHMYTQTRGYDAALMANLNQYEQEWYSIRSYYQEATAITVEEKFRQDMEYQPRNVDRYGGIGLNSAKVYGLWPRDITSKFKRNLFSGSYGVSLMQTNFIWYDIQMNYNKGMYK